MEEPYSVENVDRLGVLRFQTSGSATEKSTVNLCRADYPQNSEPQNGPRRGLDFIALVFVDSANCPTR